ncbi:hydantoinase/carbamoylase family amidase [Gluconacetobacter azotocaptans]|uniref:Hydantoinase/carbamoylase family amidase n=1 Tax=Gluconacetobacter azotocaptans TaxID=142834 RepID=A0A7W4JSX9_9PROT|nr:Zn-dependent hydrolase [Gluconacetobacter azotocaptans]MBB2190284.1 hydantoinase/carbamoylase family amidase [Gluconacetobacter azotocaptans]
MATMEPDFALARSLFDALHRIGFDGVGMTRASYDDGENRAHALLADTARGLGLEIRTDWAANLYMTLPGRDRLAPVVMTGSHVDTVPVGGNFDGAAGVVAGIALLAGWIRADCQPVHDVTVMAIRAEESAWFPVSYIGSKAAFGLLDDAALTVPQRDSGRPLAAHMAQAGGDPSNRVTAAVLAPSAIDCFVELHIEQGPVLTETDMTLGIVTGICGSLRYREVVVHGRYAHSGATPRAYRQDAMAATARLIGMLEATWLAIEAEGGEMTLTFGVCRTDPRQSDFSTIAGRVDLSIDVRSRTPSILERMDRHIHTAVTAVEAEYGVRIDLGTLSGSTPASMDAGLQDDLTSLASELGFAARSMPSGAGHDAATFANQGVPTAMLFVRNANGSHNPDEAMDFQDFVQGTELLSALLWRRAG